MILYLDTSALLKLYVDEPGTPDVQRLTSDAERRASSSIAFVEAWSALARGRATGRLADQEYRVAGRRFRQDWTEMTEIELVQRVISHVATLAERHLLRGMDAIHLASAISLKAGLGDAVTFLAFDERLTAAAQAEGLASPSV